MSWIALKMLTGDRSKYFGLIFGVTFATLLMSQQLSIFLGIMKRTGSQILDVRDADIWVMDNKVRYIDEFGRHHRLDDVDHSGRRSLGRDPESGAFSQRPLVEPGLSDSTGGDIGRQADISTSGIR